MNKRFALLGFLAFFSPFLLVGQTYDLVIYGGTSAGVAAAIQASRMGKTVILIEPGQRLGGLTTGGLGQTDIGNKQAIGGISREFYERVYQYYERPENWNWQDKEDYKGVAYSRTEEGEKSRWTFEPSAALSIYKNMLDAEHHITIVYGERLNRASGVVKEGATIRSISMENGSDYKGRVFMDATYEGDLMATAGVSYTLGRESNQTYDETLNGVQAHRYNVSLRGNVARNARNHEFVDRVDPYVIKGEPSSGLLPYIKEGGPGVEGEGDHHIQAYCYRMCLTDHPDNRIPFEKPEGYDTLNYELLFRNFEAADDLENMYTYGGGFIPWANSAMPNRKTDTNNKYGFSTDFIGQNYEYPETSYEDREKIAQAHLDYQKGLMWTLAYHPRIPDKVREEVSQWGTCKDEFEREDGWPSQLYIREARRMVSDLVMTQHHCEGLEVVEDPIGLAAYGMDSHHTQRYVDANGFVQNEGNMQSSVAGPYPVGYRSIIPKQGEADNLLVPVCLSSTHVAFGSIRMEPVFMVLGQSAAIAAALSLEEDMKLHELPYAKLKESLINYGQRIE
ncbi:FAD-dependent oxidoreductase [Pleomorphovibrio marinus]|uniref:FAD-dependent oxidoreductase n=1 Tax=Pleomorphovibrio marinus TaxID=2164132 RepID=UPI002936EEA8|nr:FAD-dependent oxidoreductase [Pleomorphovibrio marinus]